MVTAEAIWEALGTIDDPEMPISIVDLGLVEKVRVEPRCPDDSGGHSSAGESSAGKPATVAVSGPAASEPPDEALVAIDVLPTFVGCPALPMIGEEIRTKVGRLAGVRGVEVRFVFDPPWSVDRISPAGRASLAQFGVTVPSRDSHTSLPNPPSAMGHPPFTPLLVQLNAPRGPLCPFCGSDRVALESPYGPTRCRMIYYCDACRNAFEHMKRV